MSKYLSQYITINRRYARSVNLERDIDNLEMLKGYIPTERAINTLKRIINGLQSQEGNRAWTITSVYGTGKSALGQFLASLLTQENHQLRNQALEIAKQTLGEGSQDYQTLAESLPPNGYLRAVATAERESITHTIIRALNRGIESYWTATERENIPSITKLTDLTQKISTGNQIPSQDILRVIQELAEASKAGVFIIIDELGKSLEYASYNQGAEDLYLLQQISELPKDHDHPVFLLGILHQAFADYSQRLATIQRNEWAKIQGRFEDIPFSESTSAMMRLIGQGIDQTQAEAFQCAIHNTAVEWFNSLKNVLKGEEITQEILFKVYPLHTVSALALPNLCQRFAQNDRSLFTFLTSSEPFSFKNFLTETTIDHEPFPTLKLDRVYDYFIEAVGVGLANRPNLQRWVEIQDLITDSKSLEPDSLRVLKVIGILNLITTTGANRATRELVTLAMCDSPTDYQQREYWSGVINDLLTKGIITHFRQLDELRIWQGSDFNVDSAVSTEIAQTRGSLVELLTTLRPLNPLIAQRHSYKTGTLRYFERRYLDHSQNLNQLQLNSPESDGLIGYWLSEQIPDYIPPNTTDAKPFLLVIGDKLDLLRIRTREYAVLKKIQSHYPELQTDGVARKEVRYRVTEAEQLLDDILTQAFDFSLNPNPSWVQGKQYTIKAIAEFNLTLSLVCDQVYHQTPIIWNELVNRRELTSQGTKARRELITAMIEHPEQEMLGLSGYGPEVSIYYSLLADTGIHRQVSLNSWGINPPKPSSRINSFWQAIDDFCTNANDQPQTLDKIYDLLAQPPYGIKQGAIPILIAAVVLDHIDDLGVYQDGTFIPVIGAEHFELLVKDPSRFAVKYFEVVGLRSAVFKELESILRNPNLKKTGKLRNATLLTVVTPLYQFVKKLPAYTRQTQELSKEALAVLKALQQTIEPDELIFTRLPLACNLAPIGREDHHDQEIAKNLRTRLTKALREIYTAYEKLLSNCQSLLYDAFGVGSKETQLREDLGFRAKYLAGKCIERNLRSFVKVAVDKDKSDSEWLEALLMVIADKPPESWTDENVTAFEIKLADLARRFKNLEALQNETNNLTNVNVGLDSKRITVTNPDGEEIHRLVWVDNTNRDTIEEYVEQILNILPDNEQIRQGVLAGLTERILNNESAKQDKESQRN